MHDWTEDELLPRIDALASEFLVDSNVLPVAHPEWFRAGDIVRVGEDDLYDSGEVDEWGNAIMRARNEAVKVVDGETMQIERGIGANPAQAKPAGERVTILATSPF